MPTTRENELALIVYAPALVNPDGRPVAVVHELERALPGLHLGSAISDTGQFVPLPQRDAWLARERPDGGFPLLSNGNEDHLVTATGWEKPAGASPGGQALLEVHVALPLATDAIAAAPEILAGVAESARAFWGHVTPFRAGVDIARQAKDPARSQQAPPRGLPALKLPRFMNSPELPQRLGWLNYWSVAAAQAIGFPDPSRDRDLLSRARRTAMGGWIVQLTEAPLDLDIPAHLDALLRAYERFPAIGGRAPSLPST